MTTPTAEWFRTGGGGLQPPQTYADPIKPQYGNQAGTGTAVATTTGSQRGGGTGGGGSVRTGKNGTTGTTYDPNALGQTLGSQLTRFATTPAPVYDRNLYTGMDPNEVNGLGRQQGIAAWADGSGVFGRAFDAADQLQQDQGLNGNLRQGMGQVANAGSNFRQMFEQQAAPSLTEQTLMRSATGGNLGGQDPNFQALLNRNAAAMTADINGALGTTGRGGMSNLMADSIAENVGGMRLNALENERRYQDQLQRGDLSAIEGQRQTQFGNRMGANSAAQGAAGLYFDMGQTGIQNEAMAGDRLGGLFQQMLMPGQTIADIGSRYGADTQARELGAFDQFNRRENADWERFAQAMSIFGGSQGNTGMEEETPWWQTLLGTGADILGRVL